MTDNKKCKPRHEFCAYEQRHANPPRLDGCVISQIYFINTDGRKITISREILK